MCVCDGGEHIPMGCPVCATLASASLPEYMGLSRGRGSALRDTMHVATKSRRGLLTLKSRDLLALRHQPLPAIRREGKTWRRQKEEGHTDLHGGHGRWPAQKKPAWY